MTEIDGVDIHFVHVRSEHEHALPLIVMHGCPARSSSCSRSSVRSPADGTRRPRRGRFPSGDPVDAGLRVLRQADHYRLGPRPHRRA
ncbi:epoxide hydrolase N-terminal domain-containing protein [Pseudonocardia bannensis]